MTDFFVSYSHHDVAWAKWIAHQIRLAEKTVLLQEDDILPGNNFILKMHAAVQECRFTIAVLSRHFLASAFTQPEWAYALSLDPRGEFRRLVPVRIEDVEPVGLLATLVYVDLVGLNKHQAKGRLLEGLPGIETKIRKGSKHATGLEGPPYPAATAHYKAPTSAARFRRQKEIDSGNALLDSTVRGVEDQELRSLVIFDIDKMSEINRRYKSDVGDGVISKVLELIELTIPGAVTARCGEDSFFAILETDAQTLVTIAKSSVERISEYKWARSLCGGLWVTARAGVAQFRPHEHPNITILRAMAGVENAGRSGGNTVMPGPEHFAGLKDIDRERVLRMRASKVREGGNS